MKQILIFIVLFSLISCKKNEQKETKATLLINKKWNLLSVTGKRSDGTLLPPATAPTEAYDLDNYYYYKSDGTYTFNDGTFTTPGIDRVFLDQGTWSFLENEKYFQMVSPLLETDWKVRLVTLSETDLDYELPGFDGITYLYHYEVIE